MPIPMALEFVTVATQRTNSNAKSNTSTEQTITPQINVAKPETGAYCTGMLFGKHKLFERISPKKSWEGSIGGGIFCIIASFLLSHFFPFMSTGVWIGLALTVVVFGTWGDLTESLLKRRLGIKDSGNILPGHGGMLDRFDSAILAIPAAVVYLYVVSLF